MDVPMIVFNYKAMMMFLPEPICGRQASYNIVNQSNLKATKSNQICVQFPSHLNLTSFKTFNFALIWALIYVKQVQVIFILNIDFNYVFLLQKNVRHILTIDPLYLSECDGASP